MTEARLLVLLTALSVALVACGGDGGPGGSDRTLSLRGSVFSDHRVDQPCETQAANPLRPDPLAGIRLTFSSAEGDVLGTAVTGPLQWEDLEYGCRFFADYVVELPESVEYHVVFDPEPPPTTDAYYSGAEDLEPARITRQQLAASGDAWSFEAMPSYVVP